MYIRKTQRTYKGKTYTNHLLVESVQTPKGPRQKTVCSLGNLQPRSRKQWLKLAHKVEQALAGQPDLIDTTDTEVAAVVEQVRKRTEQRPGGESADPSQDPVVAVVVDKVRTEKHRQAGPAHVAHAFWKRLGLETILQTAGLDRRTRQLLCAIVLNRVIEPKAEYAIPAWLQTVALEDLLVARLETISEDALYRAMDKVHPHRHQIESALVKREMDLFNLDRTVFFYDLTSTYFEGLANANPKAKRGYSRDKRPDCKQVVVALVVNRDGFPLLHEVFDGNTQDRSTLGTMLDLIDQRIGLQQGQTVVVDRGMAYPENLETIRTHPKKLHYIVATRQSERDQWLDDFEGLEGFEELSRKPSPRNPAQKTSLVQVNTCRRDEETYALCISAERAHKDRAIREKQEGRLLNDLEALQKRVESGALKKPVKIGEAIGRIRERYPRVARYYRMELNASRGVLEFSVDVSKYAKAKELDGSYLLRSDRTDLNAEELWRTYILLTRAENAFCDMKSPLCLRPVFHQLERRVDTHIFLSILAYHLLVSIEKTMLDKGIHSSWESIRDRLRTHETCTIVLPADSGDILQIRKGSTPEPAHREIYNLLDLSPQLMKPKRTWTTTIATADS
jgi:transposase